MRTRPVAARLPVFPIVEGRALLFIAALLALFVCACSAGDRAGRERARTIGEQRVLSLLPAATEVLVALGAQERLVARTDYDDDVLLSTVHSVGRSLQPSAESVLGLTPDLVIFPAFTRISSTLLELLDQRRAIVLRPEMQTLANLYTLIDTLGTLLALPAQAALLQQRIASGLADVRRNTSGASLRVLYLVWPNPPLVAGQGTFVDELIAVAGARNAVADLHGWREVNLEEIVRRDPDLIILPVDRAQKLNPAALAELVGWRETRAVRTGRVVAVAGDLFNRPGTRVVEAARLLAAALRETRTVAQ